MSRLISPEVDSIAGGSGSGRRLKASALAIF